MSRKRTEATCFLRHASLMVFVKRWRRISGGSARASTKMVRGEDVVILT